MSGAGLFLWSSASGAAILLQAIGLLAMIGVSVSNALTIVAAIRAGKPPRAATRAEWEIAAAGFVLNQIGVIAGLILLDMKGL